MLAETLMAAGIDRPSVVTIGTFDGVHLGHQHLIGVVAERARARDVSAVALTFQPRPAEILRPDQPSLYLCSLEARQERLRQAGADAVVPLAFSHALSQMSAADFVATLVRDARMVELVGGPDLALGHRREGTIPVLRQLGASLGFEVSTVPAYEVEGEAVRSSAVQRAILDGAIERAAQLLGRRYQIEGEVVPGEGRGRTIGIPTANVAVGEKMVVPGNGVYAVYLHEHGRRLPGAANIGVRPTFAGATAPTRSIEIHVLDFDGDLYGARCSVEFVARLRPEQRFAGVGELVTQIRQDIAHARDILVVP